MTVRTVEIDPVTRIEGHLSIKIEVEDHQVIDAFSSGEMFRGFEIILNGRDPLDAQQITQRICGVCPVSHGIASVLAQDMAYGIAPPKNGRLIRNIIQGANAIQSHILHFYHLAALDFVDIAAISSYRGKDPQLLRLRQWVQYQTSSNMVYPAAPFLPRYSGDYIQSRDLNITGIKHYLEALEMRTMAHEMGAIWAGKLPHAAGIVPGGVTERVTADKIGASKAIIEKLRSFIDSAYLPDVIEVANAFPQYFNIGKGCGALLTYGVFPENDFSETRLFPAGVVQGTTLSTFDPARIAEDVRYSLYTSSSGLHPSKGSTLPGPKKEGAYSWLKAPRYNDMVVEVGPLATVVTAYLQGGNSGLNQLVDGLLTRLGKSPADLYSVMGRHAARAVQCKVVADRCSQWIDELIPGEATFQEFTIPSIGEGFGLTEAPRGALGHWIEIQDRKISHYQCVVPTTWNCSPRDDRGNPGPVEQALIGTPISDSKNPIEAARVVRSFDPCIACAVH